MGHFVSKKPFDLTEFLQQKAKPSAGRNRFSYGGRKTKANVPVVGTETSGTKPEGNDAFRD